MNTIEIIVFVIGLLVGSLLRAIFKKVSNHLTYHKKVLEKNNYVRLLGDLVILFNGTLYLLSYLRFGLNPSLIIGFILDSFIILIAMIDLEFHLIPNFIVGIMMLVGIPLSLLGQNSIQSILGGMLIGGGVLFLLFLIPKAMGGGDVKYMFVLGLYLGFYKTLMGLYISFMVAGVISILLIIFKIKKKKEYIPFGPFLSFGSFIAFHYSDQIMNIIK